VGFLSNLLGSGNSPKIGTVDGDGEFNYNIVGESQYKEALARIVKSATDDQRDAGEIYCTAVVIPEPDNKFDPNAIKVTINGATVGYIPRTDTADVRKAFKAANVDGFSCPAVVGWNADNLASGIIGVRLDLA
jgi:hypothetical protein